MANKNPNSSILLALSDGPTLTVISYHLERYGFVVNSVRNSESIIEMIDRIEPNILIIDEDIPGSIRHNDLCSLLKAKPKTKNIIIILVSKTTPVDNQFINEHIIKPFVPSELVAKIKTFSQDMLLNRNKKIISYQDIEMNVDLFKVSRQGKSIHLGPTEFKILQCFLEMPGRVLSREHIMNYVWGYNSQVEPRTIDVHINRLRSALKENDDEIPLIRTIRSAGYSFDAPLQTARV